MSDKITKTLRFDAELIRKASSIAEQENRSLNNWIETLIMREVRLRLENSVQSERNYQDKPSSNLTS